MYPQPSPPHVQPGTAHCTGRDLLAEAVTQRLNRGWRIESQRPGVVAMRIGDARMPHPAAAWFVGIFLALPTLGISLITVAMMVLLYRRRRVVLTADPDGAVQARYTIPR